MYVRNFLAVLGLLLAAFTLGSGCAGTAKRPGLPELRTVAHVDLEAYLGHWYEIARYPAWFQKDCVGSTATYSRRTDGRIDVLNRCFVETLDGKTKQARGLARVADATTGAKLKVSFFRPFWADYWIIALDPDYRYAVVGHPGRDYLWILARCPEMDEAIYSTLLETIRELGYDPDRLIRTTHPPSARCDAAVAETR